MRFLLCFMATLFLACGASAEHERLLVKVELPIAAARTTKAQARVAISSAQSRVASSLQATECTVTHRYKYIPYMAITCPEGSQGAVAVSAGVSSVHKDTIVEPHQVTPQLGDSVPLVGAAALHAQGIIGTGYNVAVLDTGVEKTHPGLGGRVVREACFANNADCPNGQKIMIGVGAGVPCNFGSACFHGTHVAGIVAAQDSQVTGMSPGAGLIAVRVFTNNNGSVVAFFSDITIAYEHLVDLVLAGVDIRAANMSLGGGPMDYPCDASFPALNAAIQLALDHGILSTVSSGNNSSSTGISSPSCLSSTLSVGCTDKSDGICSFSNSAPGLDILAPGQSIDSLDLNGGHRSASGTSMSAPHVAGALPLIYQGASPGSILDAKHALMNTGVAITDSRNGITVMRFNVQDALVTLPDPSTCGDGVREGREQCDGADDEVCPGKCLEDCLCDREGCPPCPDCPPSPRCDSCCPDPPPCDDCDSCCPDCPVPPCPPFCTDSDGDGHANDNDRCPFTPLNTDVDELGCSQTEFCEMVKITNRRQGRVCKKSDWKNDQRLATKTFECRLDNNGTWFKRSDDRCVKGVR